MLRNVCMWMGLNAVFVAQGPLKNVKTFFMSVFKGEKKFFHFLKAATALAKLIYWKQFAKFFFFET